MKKVVILFLLAICLIASGGTILGQSMKTKIPVIKIKKGEIDSTSLRATQFFYSTSHSIIGGHICTRIVDGDRYEAYLNQAFDSLLILNCAKNTRHDIGIDSLKNLPIASIYFHNLDSIFIFLAREFVAEHNVNSTNKMADFIMINSTGNVKNKFTLDSVPNIYNGKLDNMVFISAMSFNREMIFNGKLYLPFALYRPNISDLSIEKNNISLLYEYNLKDPKQSKALDVKLPDMDLGKKFMDKALTNSFDYTIFSHYMYISFYYSNKIYKIDLLTYKKELVYNDINCPFESTDSVASYFYRPIFVEGPNVFIRRIGVLNYKNFKYFDVSQVFDEKFKLLGYSFSDSVYSSLVGEDFGNIYIIDKTKNYLPYKVRIDGSYILALNELDSLLVSNKIPKKTNTKTVITSINFNIPYLDRLGMYFESLGIKPDAKIIVISTDVFCGDCIDFIMKKFQTNQQYYVDNNIKILFFGSNITMPSEIIRNYKVQALSQIIIDIDLKYKTYLHNEEMHNDPFVIFTKTDLKIIPKDPSSLVEGYKNFIEQ